MASFGISTYLTNGRSVWSKGLGHPRPLSASYPDNGFPHLHRQELVSSGYLPELP